MNLVVHDYNLNTLEAEVGMFKASLGYVGFQVNLGCIKMKLIKKKKKGSRQGGLPGGTQHITN